MREGCVFEGTTELSFRDLEELTGSGGGRERGRRAGGRGRSKNAKQDKSHVFRGMWEQW